MFNCTKAIIFPSIPMACWKRATTSGELYGFERLEVLFGYTAQRLPSVARSGGVRSGG